jgi:predicted CXXCH cytochrome family protein
MQDTRGKATVKHLVRAGAILLGVVFAAFVLPRLLDNPPALQDYGFYPKSPEENARVWASQPLRYADPAECSSCHETNYVKWQQSSHGNVLCENCHGPGVAHIEENVKLSVNTSPELCLQCHGQAVGRRADFPQIDPAAHAGGQQCVTCHDPHSPGFVSFSPESSPAPAESPPPAPESTRAAGPRSESDSDDEEGPPRVPHSLEGRADCLVCHAAGGLKPYPADHAGRPSESCLVCHQSKQV